MKKCYKCLTLKPLELFPWKVKAKDKRQDMCSECNKARLKEHYIKNKAYYIEKASNTREKIKKTIVEHLKEHPCTDCGESDIVVLEFDHLRDKIEAVSTLIQRGSLKKVLAEIPKCEVVCANCHRRRTATRGEFYKTLFA